MKVYCTLDSSGQRSLGTTFSTRDRAELELLDDELSEADGYSIEEREVSDEEYFRVLAFEAAEDNAQDDFLGGEG